MCFRRIQLPGHGMTDMAGVSETDVLTNGAAASDGCADG